VSVGVPYRPARALGRLPSSLTTHAWARSDIVAGAALAACAPLQVVVYGSQWASVVSVALCGLALTVRRRVPLAVAVVAGAAPVVDRMLGGSGALTLATLVAAVSAAYSVAVFSRLPKALVGGAFVMAGVWSGLASTPFDTTLQYLYFGVFVGFAWLAGRASRAQRQRRDTLERMSRQLEHERDVIGRMTAAEERERLARELHDAVSQYVTVMLDHAEAAACALASAPSKARDALRALQANGRAALADLGRMLRVLRIDDQAAGQRRVDDLSEPLIAGRATLRWSWRGDLVLALVAVALLFIEARGNEVFDATLRPAPVALGVLMCASLVLCQRFPVAVLLIATFAGAARHLIVGEGVPAPVSSQLVLLAATYAAAVYAPVRRSVAAVTVSALTFWAAAAITAGPGLPTAVDFAFFGVAPLLCGLALGAFRRQSEQLQLLVSRLRRERDARARLAVLEERSRLAREIHDTVAHGVSAMVVQAGAGEELLGSSPSDCRQALAVVQDAGLDTREELVRLLRTLGADDPPNTSAQGATLERLEGLITQTRRAGLPVALNVEGRANPIPASVDSAAFRIIQESLTNALKHAGAVATRVTVHYAPDDLWLEIVNGAGSAAPLPSQTGGHGLVGMRERVQLHRGTFQAGPQPDGGFRVQAHLPLPKGQ
jgi:signal transduction histidine kinase